MGLIVGGRSAATTVGIVGNRIGLNCVGGYCRGRKIGRSGVVHIIVALGIEKQIIIRPLAERAAELKGYGTVGSGFVGTTRFAAYCIITECACCIAKGN